MIMTIPTLEHLYQQFKDDKRIVFKKEIIAGKEFTIVFYQIADNEFWTQQWATETRGHVFDETGNCVSATFEKFFNINENSSCQLKDLNFYKARYYEKRDGSMISSLVIDDKVYLKTKKSFYSDVVIAAQKALTEKEENVIQVLNAFEYTAIFEYTDPAYPIVLHYGTKPQFVLLAARNRITGEYLDYQTLANIAFTHGAEIIEKYPSKTIDECLTEINEVTNREGYVIHLQSGQRVKLKFDWYRGMHRLHTALRTRDVAEMIIDSSIDDVKSAVVTQGLDISKIEVIERQVIAELLDIKTQVQKEYEIVKDMSFKDIASRNKNNPLSDCIFRLMRGKEVDYISIWKKLYLSQYPLNNLYNENF